LKALVTGSSGLIGARISSLLLSKGWEVNGLDLKEGSESGVRFFEGSITDSSSLESAMKGCDFVFHEAAASSSPMFYPDPREGVSVNVIGSMNVFHLAHELGVKKVVAASTSSIYGNGRLPSREDEYAVAPNMYAASKLAMESVGLSYSEVTGLPIIFLRYFSVYGLGERKKGNIANMVSQFIWDVLELDGPGRRPVIYGDGKQTRDLVFADDVAEANLLAATSNVRSGVFNVGTGKETSLNEMLNLICELTGRKVEAKYVENPIRNYIYRTLADTGKTERMLGFRARTTVKDGVRLILDELSQKSGQKM